MTEAILEQEMTDDRRCWITGRSFVGLDSLFRVPTDEGPNARAKLKIMLVHGIGTHTPGYAQRLIDGLVAEFSLDTMDETVKRFPLAHPEHPGELGVLSVYRFIDSQDSREVLFYELTWDSIVDEQKSLIDFDNGRESSSRRVPFNHTMKTFVNQSVPDALIYNTNYRDVIQASVAQTACWMLSEKWRDLPDREPAYCDAGRDDLWAQIDDNNIAIISHSLGSRISLDAVYATALRISQRPELTRLSAKLKQKSVYLYMLSNQLPLLQVGQPLPQVHDQIRSVCSEPGKHYQERFFEHLQIVAFSDPNDLFSYSVKPDFIERYIDSRLCPTVTNVAIEVAPVTRIFGTQAFANPQQAHTDYEADPRVLKLLVGGLDRERGDPQVRLRCSFLETIPDRR